MKKGATGRRCRVMESVFRSADQATEVSGLLNRAGLRTDLGNASEVNCDFVG